MLEVTPTHRYALWLGDGRDENITDPRKNGENAHSAGVRFGLEMIMRTLYSP